VGFDGSWVRGLNVYQWHGIYRSCDTRGGWFGILGLLTFTYCSEYLINTILDILLKIRLHPQNNSELAGLRLYSFPSQVYGTGLPKFINHSPRAQ